MQIANNILINKKILIIDDDQFSILLTKLKLRNYCDPMDIVQKNSVTSAIDYLADIEKNEPAMMPDLILLETAMEEAQGWDFITNYENWGNGMPHQAKLIILTSSQFFSDYRRSTQFDCISGFLIKPLQAELLLKLMEAPDETKNVNGAAFVNSLIV